MKRITKLFPLFIFCLIFQIECFSQRKAFESYYLHTKDYPSLGASPSWGEGGREAQGIAHDDKFWYITATERFYYGNVIPALFFSNLQTFLLGFGVFLDLNLDIDNYRNCYLWKIPLDEPLDQDFTNNAKVKQVMLLQFPKLANISDFTGYTHWGDIDYYFDDTTQTGYLIIPSTYHVNSGTHLPGLVIFRADDLSLVGFGDLNGFEVIKDGHKSNLNDGPKSIGWCAIDNAGFVYTSDDDPTLQGSGPIQFEGTTLYKYHVDWGHIKKGNNNDISGLINKEKANFLLQTPWPNSAASVPLGLHNMQGGQFSPSNELLYLSNGSGSCKGKGAGSDVNDGIHVIDTKTWTQIQRSTNHDREDPNYFDYHYDAGCGVFEVDSRSAEGLTVWDLDNEKAPNINGQLHVLVSDVSLFPANKAGIEHFSGRLEVNGDEKNPPTLQAASGAFSGTHQRPFFTVSDAFNFYPAWDGAEIVLKNGSYGDIGHYSTRVKMSGFGGAAIIGKPNPDIRGVVLYEHPDYKGDYWYFDKDIPDLDADNINFEHVASSLRLNNIKEVILYEGSGYRDPSIIITADTKSLDLIGWNDRVSSLKIIR